MRADEWILVFVLAVLQVLMWCWLKRWNRDLAAKQEHQEVDDTDWQTVPVVSMPRETQLNLSVDDTPDSPVPFGYKGSWFAIRCGDPERVIAALEPLSRQGCDWNNGVALAWGGSERVFVSPCLDGFVLVIGDVPFYRLRDLAQAFPEVQAFCSYRTSDCYSWTKYVRGDPVRAYTCLDNIIDEDFGDLTPEELELGFDRFSPDGGIWPDEEDVLAIAGAWGIDPKFKKKNYPPGTGWLCTMA